MSENQSLLENTNDQSHLEHTNDQSHLEHTDGETDSHTEELFPTGSNDVQVSVQKQPGCGVQLSVTLSPLFAQKAYDSAIKLVTKEVSVPGFRKGKAPKQFVLDSFGKQIERQWLETTSNLGVNEAIKVTKLQPLKDGEVKAHKELLSLQEGAKFIYQYEHEPMVPEINPEEIHLAMIPMQPVTEEDINTVIEQLRLQKATWNQITDRPVQEGDYIEMQVELLETPPRIVSANKRHLVAAGKMDEWILRAVVGQSLAQPFDAMSEKSQKDSKEEAEEGKELATTKEFVPQNYRFTIEKILTASLPDVTDALAAGYGAPTVEELKTNIASTLNRQSINDLRNKYREELQKFLVDKYGFDIPNSFLKKQIELCTRQVAEGIASQNKNITYEALKKQISESAEEIKQWAGKILQVEFLTQAIARKYKVSVSQEEVNNEWALVNQMYAFMKDSSPQVSKEKIAHDIFVAKTLDTLLAYIQVELPESDEANDTAEA